MAIAPPIRCRDLLTIRLMQSGSHAWRAPAMNSRAVKWFTDATSPLSQVEPETHPGEGLNRTDATASPGRPPGHRAMGLGTLADRGAGSDRIAQSGLRHRRRRYADRSACHGEDDAADRNPAEHAGRAAHRSSDLVAVPACGPAAADRPGARRARLGRRRPPG